MKKYYIKKNIIGFIVGVILCTGTFVYAAVTFPSNQVTYDNTESGLSSTNVKGAIDELYTECTTLPPGEQIIEDNNLEKDPYECRYFFTGANPNNYITFNNESWRVISVECDGTIKIMKNTDIGSMAWDNRPIEGNWGKPATLNTYLNETYLNNILNTEARGQIVLHNWSTGMVLYNNDDLAAQINDENARTWNGKIALPTLSEYLRTNSETNCKTYSANTQAYMCYNTTWMRMSNGSMWTLSPNNSTAGGAISIDYRGVVYYYNATTIRGVKPSVYLSSEVKLSGSGTQSDPYVVS